MHCDLAGVADHLVVLVDVRGAEVDENVDDKHNVHNEVDNGERVLVATVGVRGPVLRVRLDLVLLVEQEGGHVRCKDGRVDDQDENEPVPHRLEGRVVQDGEAVNPRRLELVLGEHLRPQRQHLATGEGAIKDYFSQ